MARSNRLHPLLAYRAWKRLWLDPDDTEAVFEILEALRGQSEERVYRRFRRSAVGRAVLAEERDLIDTLNDRAALRALPAGSLGAAYASFMDQENISADGLAEASESRSAPIEDPSLRRFVDRWRDMHDLHHVVTGYGRDLHGEAGLLAFTLAQTPTLGLAFLVGMAYLNGDSEDRRLIREGWGRGRRAAWWVSADWEALLERPLAEVRETLRSGASSPYTPLWSQEAPGAATQEVPS